MPEIIRGYVFGIFPADCTKEKIYVIDCWFNRNFLWLLHFMRDVLKFMCAVSGIKFIWIVRLKKDDKL